MLRNCTLKQIALPTEQTKLKDAEKKLLEIGTVMRESKNFTVSRLKLLTLNTEARTKCFESL